MGILDKILLSEGVTKEELAYFKLSDKEKRNLLPNPLMPASEAFTLQGTETITRSRGEQLCREGISLGIITEPLAIPYDVEPLPSEVAQKEVHQNFISPFLRGMNGKYRTKLADDGVVYMANIDTGKEHPINNYLTLEDTPELYAFIMGGGAAILDIWAFSVSWISEAHYNEIQEYKEAADKFGELTYQWWRLLTKVRDSKDPYCITKEAEQVEKACVAKERMANLPKHLNNLPFKWESAIKEVLSGLSERSDGTGCRKNTVVHVRLLEDYKNGRFGRKKHDYLCSPKKVANWGDSDWSGHDITCKACIAKVEVLGK